MKFINDFVEKRIRKLAYYRYLDRGCVDGKDKGDWHVCVKWWPWNWIWVKIPKKFFVFIIILIILVGQAFYDLSFTRILGHAVPPQIKDPISQNKTILANFNINLDVFDKELAHRINEFRYPLFKDLMIRIMVRTKYFLKPRPFIIIHQSAYAYVYFDKDKDAQGTLIPFIALKNIGNDMAIITRVNVQTFNPGKLNIIPPDFAFLLPKELFPNEELILFYGQEMPPPKYVSTIDVSYKDLKGKKIEECNKKEFLDIFSKKILN